MTVSQEIQQLLDEQFQDAVGDALPKLRDLSDFLDGLIEENVPHPRVVRMRKRVSEIICLIEVGAIPPKENS